MGFTHAYGSVMDEKDEKEVAKVIEQAVDIGYTYFDTAYVYDNGDSERAAKEALVDRYPRESFTLATKLCAWR